MKVIVTGGAGFIGSNLARDLVYEGHDVLVIDNLYSGQKKFVPDKAQFKMVDIRSKKDIDKIFMDFKPEIVFHEAAQSQVSTSMIDPKLDLTVNLVGLVNLLDASVSCGTVRKFIMPSSAAVYGESSADVMDESAQLNPPVSFYGLTKATTEKYLELYKRHFGLDYICFRYSNVYGPRQGDSSEAGVISIFVKLALEDKTATIYGTGEQLRDYIYVDDVVRANILVMNSDLSGVYNLSTGHGTSVNDIYQLINKYIRLNVEYADPRPGDPMKSILDPTKLAKDLRTTLTCTPIDKGIKSTIDYFKYN